ETAQGVLHVSPKLSAGGEDIGLFSASGTLLDGLTFGPQSADVSFGRLPDGGADFQFFTAPSPGASNAGASGGNFAEAPTASVPGGFFSNVFEITLSTTTPGAQIRYTLDGSEPAGNSTLYMAPLPVSQTTTLRARAFANGLLPSAVTTHTYLFEAGHTFPVVALSFRDADFFDGATGIYPNYTEDWERPVHVGFFETDGMPGFSQEATAKIHGTGSAQLPQKSLKIRAVASNGDGFFQHPVFPDLPFEEYKSLLLRNAGQDWNITMFRDAFVASLAADLTDVGDIIAPPRLHLQAFRPGVAYFNGQYWGIHNLQEHMQADYIGQHFGLSENEIDLLDNGTDASAGDFDRWNSFMQFLNANYFGSDQNYQQLGQQLDLPHFLDYNAFNILIDNSDWPGNNFRRWRQRSNDARWRFLSFDFDFSFGLLKIEADTLLFNTGDASANSLARALDATATVWPNPSWTTLPLRKAMENPVFRRDFINRAADFLNVLFSPDRVKARIDAFEATYAPEVQRHFDRWSAGWNPWAANVQILRHFGEERPAFVRQHFVDFFDEITGTANVTLRAEPPGSGGVSFSTLYFGPDKLPWSGVYFTGIEIPVQADAAPGFVFSGWSRTSLGSEPSAKVSFTADEALTAFFEKGSTTRDTVVVNEINYNSPGGGDWVELFNPNHHAVDISGWVVEDAGGGYFVLPAATVLPPDGYMVLVENSAEFSSLYPLTTNQLGDFGAGGHGFRLGNSGDVVLLKNANLETIDSVRYDDELPWPLPIAIGTDGTGHSLQLIDWKADNTLPQFWKAQPPTPGLPNQSSILAQTIDFHPIGDKFTIGLPFVVSATASSGLPVAFTVTDGPATVNGNFVTLTGIEGTVTIRASQQGDLAWQAAEPVFETFQVVKWPTGGTEDSSAVFDILPNPVGNSLGVHFTTIENGSVRLTISAANGVELRQEKFDLQAGQHYVELDVSNLTQGAYALTINTLGQRQRNLKFVKTE
ncbi:MAG: CotH kinase family protein, partial [Bacteroidetes bacterium]|nr:CotH kinase family protein [Bacteroidota bacterium]